MMMFFWIPVSYAIYLYANEKNDLVNTAREFTAFKDDTQFNLERKA